MKLLLAIFLAEKPRAPMDENVNVANYSDGGLIVLPGREIQ
jgi:hypothetical protein